MRNPAYCPDHLERSFHKYPPPTADPQRTALGNAPYILEQQESKLHTRAQLVEPRSLLILLQLRHSSATSQTVITVNHLVQACEPEAPKIFVRLIIFFTCEPAWLLNFSELFFTFFLNFVAVAYVWNTTRQYILLYFTLGAPAVSFRNLHTQTFF